MKILGILIVHLVIFSCNCYQNENSELKQFWEEFQTEINEKDIQGISSMIQFPLKDAQIYAGRYDGGGLKKEEFKEVYSRIFTDEINSQISESTVDDLKKDENNKHIHSNAFKIIFELEVPEEENSQIVLFVGKVKGEYKIVYFVLIG